MAALKWRGPLPRNAGSDPQECRKLAAVDNLNHKPSAPNLKELPSRAALARRWPSLKVNRYTGAWRDDASGARGDDIQSLRAFLGDGGR